MSQGLNPQKEKGTLCRTAWKKGLQSRGMANNPGSKINGDNNASLGHDSGGGLQCFPWHMWPRDTLSCLRLRRRADLQDVQFYKQKNAAQEQPTVPYSADHAFGELDRDQNPRTSKESDKILLVSLWGLKIFLHKKRGFYKDVVFQNESQAAPPPSFTVCRRLPLSAVSCCLRDGVSSLACGALCTGVPVVLCALCSPPVHFSRSARLQAPLQGVFKPCYRIFGASAIRNRRARTTAAEQVE